MTPSLKHQRPKELLKTCVVLCICNCSEYASFPTRLASFAERIKLFVASIKDEHPYLIKHLNIPSMVGSVEHTVYSLHQVIASETFYEFSGCIKQILVEIASMRTDDNEPLLTLSKTMDCSSPNASFYFEVDTSELNKTVILRCNISKFCEHLAIKALLTKIRTIKREYFERGKDGMRQRSQIPKKRTWHEVADEDLLFCSNFYFPVSKRRRVAIDDKQHNDEILQRIPLSNAATANKTIKEIQDEISDLLDYKSSKTLSYVDTSNQIIDMLRTPTTRDILVNNLYSTRHNNAVNEFCDFGTKHECKRANNLPRECDKIHFIRIMRPHTMPNLGDCSYLDGCRHMDTCRFIHYVIDEEAVAKKRPYFRARKVLNKLLYKRQNENKMNHGEQDDKDHDSDSSVNTEVLQLQIYQNPAIHRYEAQWVNCDVRALDFNVLNKYGVIMADPPWDIHMELPYGTLTDEEMLDLKLDVLADESCLLFLWVTGRVMETARKCMQKWGFECQEEVLWIKTNQLQRIIRTGRTGHWLNHSKEHCLVGVKGNDKRWNRCLDTDVIVAEVRETSRKPDEIYNVIERLSPGTKKIEIFGRPHNTKPGWMTLGNQLNGTRILDPAIAKKFKNKYPTIQFTTTITEKEEEEANEVSQNESGSENDSYSGSGSDESDTSRTSSSRSGSSTESRSDTGSYDSESDSNVEDDDLSNK